MNKGKFIEINKNRVLSGNIIYLIALVLPLAIFLVLFGIKGISPFGKYVYLSSDMYHQYCPFFSEMNHKLQNGGSLLYSWDIGLGTNFTALFAYYISSPLNFLLSFTPHSMTAPLMDMIIVIKMMLASLFFTIYVSKRFKSKSVMIVIFAVFYCMSGYIAAFAWNIMWLDCVAVFPLVMLGLERLVYKKRPFLFIIALGLSVIFNYYISIMVVFAAIIYFICLLFVFEKNGERFAVIKRILLFLAACAVAAGLSAVLLLPEIHAFGLSASSSSTFPTTFKAYHSFLQEFSRHMTYSPSYTWLKHYPNIYCGIFSVALLPIFFLSKKIPTKQKIIKGIIIGIFLFSFMFNIPEYIWHGFHFPNCLPARQSFIYIFFVLIMGYEAVSHFKHVRTRDILISAEICAALLVVFAIAYHGEKSVADDDNFTYSLTLILLNAMFLAAYFVLFLLFRKNNRLRLAATLGLFAVAVAECSTHMFNTGLGLVNYTDYQKNDENYAEILRRIKNENTDTEFYRVDQEAARTANDGSWYHYRSVNAFSSTSTAGVSDFYKSFGTKASMNSYQRLGATSFLDMLLSSKYIVSTTKLTGDDPLKQLHFEHGGLYVYKNDYTLPLGYLIPESLAQKEIQKSASVGGAVNHQNEVFESLTGISDLLTVHSDLEGVKEYSFKAKADGHYYITFRSTLPESITVTVNEGEAIAFSDIQKHNRLIDIGYIKKDDSVKITSDDEMTGFIAYLDAAKLIEGYEKIKPSGLEITSFSDTEVKGKFSSDQADRYMFTIPYEKGWSVYVDGKQVQTSPAMGAFLSVKVEAGEHEVVLKYMPYGLMPGVAITLASTGALAAWMIVYNIRNKGRKLR